MRSRERLLEKQKLLGGVAEDLRETLLQEIRVLDDRISAEEAGLLENKKERLKEKGGEPMRRGEEIQMCC